MSKAGCWTTSVYRGKQQSSGQEGGVGTPKEHCTMSLKFKFFFSLNNMGRQFTLSVWVTVFLSVKWVLQNLSGLISLIFSNCSGVRHWPIRTGAAVNSGRPCWCGLAASQPQGAVFRAPSCPGHLWSHDLFPNKIILWFAQRFSFVCLIFYNILPKWFISLCTKTIWRKVHLIGYHDLVLWI